MQVTELGIEKVDLVSQAAALLVDGFKDTGSTSWPDLEAGLKEVKESFQDGRISLAAIDENRTLLGWIGGIREYDGHAWELHPLVVKSEYQHRGIGRALVAALEDRVKQEGASTLYLGTDDENYRTSISGTDLYPDVLGNLSRIKNLKGHPYEFYQKVGFTIVGVIPDANGLGKPDIFMAKRVGKR
jgi:aminoglycoside 6'-N-acetyltransferase I